MLYMVNQPTQNLVYIGLESCKFTLTNVMVPQPFSSVRVAYLKLPIFSRILIGSFTIEAKVNIFFQQANKTFYSFCCLFKNSSWYLPTYLKNNLLP